MGAIKNDLIISQKAVRKRRITDVVSTTLGNAQGMRLLECILGIAQRPANAHRAIVQLLGKNHADLLPTPIVNILEDNAVIRIHKFYECYCFVFLMKVNNY